VLSSSLEQIERRVGERALVLDVGGWASPMARADWVIDLMPYESRGLYGEPPDPARERFDSSTWVRRDICDREPWPFADQQFDFVVCSHTLEDVRDPVWVCSELVRVGKAGYVEVPSRLEEQSWGVIGDYAGWSHHRWLVEIADGSVEFVAKPHVLHANPAFHLPAELGATLTEHERVETLFWDGSFDYGERIFTEAEELDRYLEGLVASRRAELEARLPRPSGARRLGRRLLGRR
jgi:Methyltransferase domain